MNSTTSTRTVDREQCERCVHYHMCQGTAAPDQIPGQRIRVSRHESLYRQGDLVDNSIYSIRSGSFKIVGAGVARPEQIVGFALAPEFIALNAMGQVVHQSSAVALEDSEVCRITWQRQAFKGRRQPLQRVSLHALMSAELRRSQQQALMTRNTQAGQRLAALMLGLSEHHASRGYAAGAFRLPMSHGDIANYLGVTAECVSRLILHFKQQGILELRRHDVELLDMDALRGLVQDCTARKAA